MKFTNYFEHIAGVSFFPIVSLLLFVVFFVGVTFWAFSVDKSVIKHMEELPLDDKES